MSAVLKPRLEFVPMRETDVDPVTAAEQRSYAFPWTRGNFADSLKAGHSMWVCREGGEMVGYVVVMMVVDEAHLLNITILPEHQRRGLGSALLGHMFDVARGYGAVRMLLEVRPDNASGFALYRRFLFSEIGRRRGYYPADGGREDAIVMARDL
ncbi:MAG TPA: ribosomal protein S18-alanine N-acetyltransferase [Rhodocyclaceae bacterium]|nr:ribosomal protein S18-alanine N-acetyltransferase [Rhodocyclaceae bacterium]